MIFAIIRGETRIIQVGAYMAMRQHDADAASFCAFACPEHALFRYRPHYRPVRQKSPLAFPDGRTRCLCRGRFRLLRERNFSPQASSPKNLFAYLRRVGVSRLFALLRRTRVDEIAREPSGIAYHPWTQRAVDSHGSELAVVG